MFYYCGSWGRGFGCRKASLSPAPSPPPPLANAIHYWPFQDGTFIVVLFVNCYGMFLLSTFFSFNNYASWLCIQLSMGNIGATFLGKELPALPAICSICGCFIVFVCLSLWCWCFHVALIVSVPEFSYSLCPCRGEHRITQYRNVTETSTLVLLIPDIPCLGKQCRSRSVGGSQLIWICTVCH